MTRSTVSLLGGATTVVAATILAAACGGRIGSVSAVYYDAGHDAPNSPRPKAGGADASARTASGEVVASDERPGASGEAGADTGGDGREPPAYVRLADWAPDAPSAGFDLCIAERGGRGTWTGPLLQGAGVAFPYVGRYVPVAAGEYNVRVVAPGSPDCASAVAPGAGDAPAVTVGARATIALVGELSPTGDAQGPQLVALADDVAAPAGRAAVRFVDALPGPSAVVFGTGSESRLDFSPLTGAVPFAGVSTTPADAGAADANGYLLLAPQAGAGLSAQVSGNQFDETTGTTTTLGDAGFVTTGGSEGFTPGTDLASGASASWSAGAAVTVALVAAGGSQPPAQLVVCQDDAPAQGPLSACTVLAAPVP